MTWNGLAVGMCWTLEWVGISWNEYEWVGMSWNGFG